MNTNFFDTEKAAQKMGQVQGIHTSKYLVQNFVEAVGIEY